MWVFEMGQKSGKTQQLKVHVVTHDAQTRLQHSCLSATQPFISFFLLFEDINTSVLPLTYGNAEDVCLQLHQQPIGRHASIHLQLCQRNAAVLVHGIEDLIQPVEQ